MSEITSIAAQVKHNCNISDAKYWGFYSPCGLLLRMRDLYKTEQGIRPWGDVSHKAIGDWLEKREGLWHSLENREYREIQVKGKSYDPFDVKAVNRSLSEEGYFYGAGLGNMLKPVFILGKLSDQKLKGRYQIFILESEIARDLSTSPAMIQGNTIIARQEAMEIFLWGKYEEMKSRKCAGSLHDAFSEYGMAGDSEGKSVEDMLSDIVREELRTYIYHELGEAAQRRVLGRWWKKLLLRIPYSRAELFTRSLKDIMSDTCSSGMLAYIIKKRKRGSLSFYVSLLSGYRKIIFPGIITAYREFRNTENWDVIEHARSDGYKKAGDYVRQLKEMFDKGNASAETIERELLAGITQ